MRGTISSARRRRSPGPAYPRRGPYASSFASIGCVRPVCGRGSDRDSSRPSHPRDTSTRTPTRSRWSTWHGPRTADRRPAATTSWWRRGSSPRGRPPLRRCRSLSGPFSTRHSRGCRDLHQLWPHLPGNAQAGSERVVSAARAARCRTRARVFGSGARGRVRRARQRAAGSCCSSTPSRPRTRPSPGSR